MKRITLQRCVVAGRDRGPDGRILRAMSILGDTSADAVAEDLDAYILRPPNATREDTGYAVLIDGPDPSPLNRFAARVRIEGNPDPAIVEVRAWFRHRGRNAFTWKLGPNTTPSDLESRLRSHGAHQDEAEPEHTAMVLDREPPSVPAIDVRVVESYEDFLTAAEIIFVGFGGSLTADEIAMMREALPERYNQYRNQSVSKRYLAFVDGVPVGMATAIQTSAGVMALGGGATLPDARGRGAYRALVHARWVDAIRAGSSALATQASGMSRPILERLGFRAVGPVLELIDTTDG